MLKQMIAGYAALAVLIVGVAAAEDAVRAEPTPDLQPEPVPQACPSVFSQRAVKIGGTASGYPPECALPVCRVMNAQAEKKTLVFCQFGVCTYALHWRYKIQLGSVPATACPSDVVAGPWVAP